MGSGRGRCFDARCCSTRLRKAVRAERRRARGALRPESRPQRHLDPLIIFPARRQAPERALSRRLIAARAAAAQRRPQPPEVQGVECLQLKEGEGEEIP